MTSAQDKAALRARYRTARAAVPPTVRARWSAAITARLAALPELAGADAVLGYAATPQEVDVGAWLEPHLRRGGRLFLPRVDGPQIRVCQVGDLEVDLRPGWRGLREPRAGLPVVAPDALDAVIVPGVAFDLRGGRLGQGGGHMDRLLARLRAGTPVVAPAFAVQVLGEGDGLVPMEDHDVRVDVIVTEQQVHRRG